MRGSRALYRRGPRASIGISMWSPEEWADKLLEEETAVTEVERSAVTGPHSRMSMTAAGAALSVVGRFGHPVDHLLASGACVPLLPPAHACMRALCAVHAYRAAHATA